MQITFPTNLPLPGLRRDLKIFLGPQDDDGAPTYSIYDPVKSQYYKISWTERMILALYRPGMTLENLYFELKKRTTLQPEMSELQNFFLEANYNGLFQVPADSEKLYDISKRAEGGWLWWLLLHYLYLRFPLVKPDKFLRSTLKYAKFLVSYPMLILYSILIFKGLMIIITRWDAYIHTILNFFSFEGALWYAVGICFVKVVHEFAHAYTAAAFGVHVPSMGIALIVLWPVLYTDVTHSWRLSSRGQRFLISAAGVIAEIILAGIATLGWALSSPGTFQSMCYVISTSSLATTLIINLNPALRFDGYYLLCDIWGIDNLQDRAFRIARWKLHQIFLGIEAPCPEPHLESRTIVGMTIYSVYTWLYRITLYTTIAIFVYFAFTKSLGLILFLAEILIFLVWPFYTEVKEIYQVKKYFKSKARFYTTLSVLGLLLLWFVIPLPHTYSFTAFSVPSSWQNVYVPDASEVDKIFISRGDQVNIGDPLIQLKSVNLDKALEGAKVEINIQQNRIDRAETEQSLYNTISQEEATLARLKEKEKQLQNQIDSLSIFAELNGIVYDWNKNLFVGESLPTGAELGKIANLKNVEAYVFVPEDKIKTVILQNEAEFYTPSSDTVYPGKIISMQPFRAIDFNYIPLASVFGGTLPVIQKNNKLEIIDTYYLIVIQLEGDKLPPFGQTGYARWNGPASSYAMDLFRFIHSIILRESGF